ncbi:tyrosine-type recombinase/integrase [Sphingomonas sp. MMS24-J13]|uniref:tyrosine-type recombinase/integrase n=1 Tax=Sphingomonas sp. MMS24-J13 TaxID=3238686 RepID=UPI00384F9C28
MALTVTEVKNAQPAAADYKLGDEKGLYLLVTTKGAKSWRMKYQFGEPPAPGKRPPERRLTFGLYPEVTLKEARDRRDAARDLLRQGLDPSAEADRQRKEAAAAAASATATFKVVAEEWHEAEKARWSPGQALLVMRALKRDIFPDLGHRPVAEITGPDILVVLRKIEARGAIETAKRVKGYVSDIFERAIGEHYLPGDDPKNPCEKIGKALRPTPKGAKQPAITDIGELRRLQARVDASTAGPLVKLCSRLLALTSVRIGVLRTVTWEEFEGIDWDAPDSPAPNAVWRIPAERMKLEVEEKGDAAFDHDVPLQPQAVEALRAVRPLTGRTRYLFPSQRTTRKPMSDAALSKVYLRLGYKGRHVPHGWRAAFSTIMNERAVDLERDGDRIAIDLMLAHAPKGISASEYSYNRAKHSKRRREIANAWADMLCEGLAPAMSLLKGQDRG